MLKYRHNGPNPRGHDGLQEIVIGVSISPSLLWEMAIDKLRGSLGQATGFVLVFCGCSGYGPRKFPIKSIA